MAARRGSLVIVSSPSGAGKTTLTRRLLAEHPTVEFSVSFTTRPARAGEIEGRDYHFVDEQCFRGMIDAGEFAEHAVVHGNHYGTAKAPIEIALGRGQDVIFDVDWQGGASLSAMWPDDSLKIFILPPDLATLADRLRRRATDAPDVIERRLRKAIEELAHYVAYQHLIVNAELEHAYKVMQAVYLTRRYGRISLDSQPAGLPASLEQLAEIVDANQRTQPDRHAQALIASA